MFLPDFDYYAPSNIAEINVLLAQLGPKAKIISGGTDLLIKMKHGLLAPEALVSLKKLEELTSIEHRPGVGVMIGARATHSDLINSTILNEKYLSISETAHHMAANQVRNIGTVGGNICNAVPSADLPPILIALRASIKLVGPDGERMVRLEDFFVGPGKSVLGQNELLTEIIIPDQATTGSHYIKFSLRRSGALAVVGVAVAVTVVGETINDARIVLGAVAPTPMRAWGAEELIKGKKVNDDLLAEAGVIASRECKPISDIRGSEEYRRDLVRIFTKRALHRAINEGHV